MAVINFKVLPAASAAASAAAAAANSIYNCHMMAMGRPKHSDIRGATSISDALIVLFASCDGLYQSYWSRSTME